VRAERQERGRRTACWPGRDGEVGAGYRRTRHGGKIPAPHRASKAKGPVVRIAPPGRAFVAEAIALLFVGDLEVFDSWMRFFFDGSTLARGPLGFR
jgi:hypothetical protein